MSAKQPLSETETTEPAQADPASVQTASTASVEEAAVGDGVPADAADSGTTDTDDAPAPTAPNVTDGNVTDGNVTDGTVTAGNVTDADARGADSTAADPADAPDARVDAGPPAAAAVSADEVAPRTQEPAADREPAADPVPGAPATGGDEATAAPAPVPPPPVELSGPPTQRLRQLGLDLPPVATPVGAYLPAVRTGNLIFTSGQLPMVDGALQWTGVVGDQPVDLPTEQARGLARLAALNAIAAIASLVDINQVSRVVKVVGYVASAPGFTQQPQVVNGASELLEQVWGDSGRHARSAVGVAALPMNSPVEVELVVEVGAQHAAPATPPQG